MDHKVNGNSAFFSRSEKATFEEILKPEEVQNRATPQDSTAILPVNQPSQRPQICWPMAVVAVLLASVARSLFRLQAANS